MRDVFKPPVAPVDSTIAPAPRAGAAAFAVTKHGDGELGSLMLLRAASEECALGIRPRGSLVPGAD